MDCGMAGMGWPMMLGAWLVGLLLLAAAVAGVVWLVRRTGGPAGGAGSADTAQEVLRRRYAAGEIDEEEFVRRRDRLG
ncbi:SHOCT domain-containing protein [Cellulomonas sp. ATA003]|uniref:SHOCT domain-containing protein n=1 Tax=Cellulomonas sp. ATA003 TaxID=3073064 RepID=UPI002872DCAC|nr:SHOCT domain-containing protein [Cellulomonas sp. ATA003]WNB84756.1 SHOCT domain-containing protein [Cellulomonas sp. ATA003]